VPGHTVAATRVTLNGVVRPDLDISVHHEQEEVVVSLAGELDIGTVPRLVTAVEEALGDSPTRLVLDLGSVTFCDSQGLGTLVVLNRTATRARSSLVLTNVGDFLDRLLHVTGLRQAFTIRDGAAPG
jgi:anti-anti-sigma factor